MVPTVKPVFYSSSPTRWRACLLVAFTVCATFAAASYIIFSAVTALPYVPLPKLTGENELYRSLLNPDQITTLRTGANEDYRRLRAQIQGKIEFNYPQKKVSNPVNAKPIEGPIRAGFYVNWDAQSYYSLREHIDSLNLVFPEWSFVPDTGDEVALDIDQRALSLLREHQVAIVPMLSNFFSGKWNGGNVHRILRSKESRRTMINSILRMLEANKFSGINIDFEELEERSDENFVAFQKELYEALHEKHFLVTQDVSPLNEDYDLPRLAKYNDYLMLMAYDQHFATSAPGPIAAQKWVEGILDTVLLKIPQEKVILGVPSYGYDWPDGAVGSDVTYQEAVVRASESDGKLIYDNDNYNVHYKYSDDNQRDHEVWFADAATTFNAMRAADDVQCAGIAVWRLGGEDPRMWQFFGRSLDERTLRQTPFDFGKLSSQSPASHVDYEGEGEILDVAATPKPGQIRLQENGNEQLISEEVYRESPTSFVVRKFGKQDNQIALTFDDGPDETYTPRILDILSRENVPATFFVVGMNAEDNLGLLKRIYSEGHEIGNHSFTHPNLAETGSARTEVEINLTQRLIESTLGRSTVLFRPPYNADSEPESAAEITPVVIAKQFHYYTIGESIDPRDWEEDITPDRIVERIAEQASNGNIVLLHDAGGDREATVQALPRIIKYFRDRGMTFVPVSRLMGKTRDTVMPPLSSSKDIYLSKANWAIANWVNFSSEVIRWLFLITIALSIARSVTFAVLASRQKRRRAAEQVWSPTTYPKISVVIPAYNESVNATKTIASLLQSEYPDFEIIFVDDGSKDDTFERVVAAFGEDKRVRIHHKANGGKASALNAGIGLATGEILVCVDADTQFLPTSLDALSRRFANPNVAAVAGNVKIGNKTTLLSKWQSIEYICSQNFDRRVFVLLNCVTVIPGAIGAFRRDAIEAVGGFHQDTLAEDCDITIALLREGYVVDFAEDAVAFTEAPEGLRAFLTQRFRWSFGILQSVWKHRGAFLNAEQPALGFLALPYCLVFQFILPLLAPITDVVLIAAFVSNCWYRIGAYFAAMTFVDLLAAALAFRFEGERLRSLWLIIPQRFVYRYLMFFVALKTMLSMLRGSFTGWGVIRRTGNVKVEVTRPLPQTTILDGGEITHIPAHALKPTSSSSEDTFRV
ncbi:MAG: glycosyltransferase [Bdellovibrionota bacterium]